MAIPDAWPNCAVPLSRYADIIGYDQSAFWGVRYDGQEQFECHTFWTEWMRQQVADSLATAQQMMEDLLGYPLCPTWITGTIPDSGDARYTDQQAAVGNPITTAWGHVLQAGVMAESVIDDDATVDYTVEPAVIGPIATSVTDTAEVKVYFPDSDRIITPSRVVISGGSLTIYVPRCRLVDPDLLSTITGSVGVEYDDTDNFVTVVDVHRVYNDPSINAYLVREHSCDALCTAEGCATQTDAACMIIKDPIIGIVRVHPATYSSGWTQIAPQYCWNHVRLNYQAGLRTVNRQLENVLVRLAHSLMPEEPCGCEATQRLWMRDRKVSEVLSREMLNCPWGYSAGALFAWAWANQNAQWSGSVL
jgi:hypothetical protein